jgi:hypothetical protein
VEDQPLELVVIIDVLHWFPVSTAKPIGDADKKCGGYLCFISHSGLEIGGMVDNIQEL